MVGDRIIKRDDLVRVLEADKSVGETRLIEILAASDSSELALKPIPVRDLRVIYERRRARIPDSHPMSVTVDHLLTALADYQDDEVNVVTLEAPHAVAAVWLTKSADAVLATLVDEYGR